ncbi:MAG: SAM hydrolase/SAM-dependent halogenase family protein [Gemmataceae bacterium]
MADPLITLTTDFGSGSHYVAAAKGVLLALNPDARIVDLSHDIPAQDLRQTAFFLVSTLPYFPPETLHMVVVDPGVGGQRAILYVEFANLRLLVPDNGCWTWLLAGGRRRPRVIRVTEKRFWRSRVSATFHGRDIFAPVAANLSLGLDPRELGPIVSDWVRLDRPAPHFEANGISGEVLYIDRFGNLITNIPGEAVTLDERPKRIRVSGVEVPRIVRTYSDAEAGTLLALVSSSEWLEVAVNRGDAARHLDARIGTEVTIEWQRSDP